MTVKLVALYRKSDDVDAFMRHYEQVHLPLVRKTPPPGRRGQPGDGLPHGRAGLLPNGGDELSRRRSL